VQHSEPAGRFACRVPESWARAAFMLGADIAWRRHGRGVQVLERNMRRAIGRTRTRGNRAAVPGGDALVHGSRAPNRRICTRSAIRAELTPGPHVRRVSIRTARLNWGLV